MAGGSPEHHMDRVGHCLGDCAGDPVLAASFGGIEAVAARKDGGIRRRVETEAGAFEIECVPLLLIDPPMLSRWARPLSHVASTALRPAQSDRRERLTPTLDHGR